MKPIADSVHHEFAQLLELQPYTVVMDDLVITVDEDVFPPDLGRCARNMAKIGGEYRPRRALDMGCGSGYLALALKQQGVPDVWALDVHEPAISCARQNHEQNRHVGPLTIAVSDLFDAVPPGLSSTWSCSTSRSRPLPPRHCAAAVPTAGTRSAGASSSTCGLVSRQEGAS